MHFLGSLKWISFLCSIYRINMKLFKIFQKSSLKYLPFQICSFSLLLFFLNKHSLLASRNLLYAEPAEPEFHNYA